MRKKNLKVTHPYFQYFAVKKILDINFVVALCEFFYPLPYHAIDLLCVKMSLFTGINRSEWRIFFGGGGCY
jgi:hypothetical protein